jgi:transcription termination factor Rho
VLSRELADRRVFPAIDIVASATRREELLLSPEALALSRAMRRQLAGKGASEAMSELLHVMKKTKIPRAEELASEQGRRRRLPG